MRCLVTGGCGFIGSHLVDLLLAEGHSVVILDNKPIGRRLPQEFCRVVVGDVTRIADVYDAMVGCQVVFHLAASVGNTLSIVDPHHDAQVNVLGTINILEVSRSANIQRVVYSSSAGVYGEAPELPIKESCPCRPDSPYGCTKLCAEQLCLVYRQLHGLGTVCLRYFNVYGPRQRYDAYGNVLPIFAEKMRLRQPLTIHGGGEQTRDFVHVRDVAMANYLAATVPEASGVYNVGSGEETSVNCLIKMLEYGDLVHGEHRPGDVFQSVANISKAERELGYHPQTRLVNGVKEYLSWYRETEGELR